MASKLFVLSIRQNIPIHMRRMSSSNGYEYVNVIGNRDVVGYGYNGEENYMDRLDFPMPAIRFKANTPDVMALREKEKGDWKKLSIQEKKELYRASYRQTLVELQAPSGSWKGSIGVALLGVALSLWTMIFLKLYAMPPLPKTFDDEHRLAQMERMKALDMNPINGISSKYF
ncbi:cytochrome c oxidase subunit 4 isoform 1, mitochondrial [Ptiloglossa arizonensis]|uniref:cytochrome c oxidase subunit 4 isoform 1, mitochondrial n=1 Tax=Ptiloglossa arizonensis TaxID=3350558 RepID=UPI003FA15F7E